MKWLVRLAAGVAIAYILLAVSVWEQTIYRFPILILLILVAVGIYEGIDMSRIFGHDDDDDESGPFRPA